MICLENWVASGHLASVTSMPFTIHAGDAVGTYITFSDYKIIASCTSYYSSLNNYCHTLPSVVHDFLEWIWQSVL